MAKLNEYEVIKVSDCILKIKLVFIMAITLNSLFIIVINNVLIYHKYFFFNLMKTEHSPPHVSILCLAMLIKVD